MTATPDPPTKERLRQYLDMSRRLLFEAVGGLTEEEMRRRLAEDSWSVAEVLAHVPAAERRIVAQARAVCERAGSAIEFLGDRERKETAGRGGRLPAPALIHDLVAARWETTRFLESLREQEMSCSGRHQRFGDVTVAQLVGVIPYHERQHAEQVQGIRRALGLGDFGTGPGPRTSEGQSPRASGPRGAIGRSC